MSLIVNKSILTSFHVRFVFTCSFLLDGSCLIYVVVCLFVHQILCFSFVFLRLVYLMLPVSLDCSLLSALSVFSNVYSDKYNKISSQIQLIVFEYLNANGNVEVHTDQLNMVMFLYLSQTLIQIATSETGTVYPSEAPEFTPSFTLFLCLSFCVVFFVLIVLVLCRGTNVLCGSGFSINDCPVSFL